MIGGIALLGTVTATLASWLVEAVAAEKEQAEDIQVTVRRLEDKIDRLTEEKQRGLSDRGQLLPQDVQSDHDHSHAFPSPSRSSSYGSEPVTRTGPLYLGPSPEPPRQS